MATYLVNSLMWVGSSWAPGSGCIRDHGDGLTLQLWRVGQAAVACEDVSPKRLPKPQTAISHLWF